MNRFIKEYAAHKIKQIKDNELTQDWYKNDTTLKIKRAVELYNQYMLSVDETMRIIANA